MAVEDDRTRRTRLRDQAATAAARAGGIASLAVVLLGAPAVGHVTGHATASGVHSTTVTAGRSTTTASTSAAATASSPDS